ncbi:MAG: GAF domain-containing protein [Fulvivirga sp.]
MKTILTGSNDQNEFDVIFNCSISPMVLVDVEKDAVLQANHSAIELLNYPGLDDLLKMSLSKIYPKRDALIKLIQDTTERGRNWTNRITCETYDGRSLPVEITATNIFLNKKQYTLVMFRDLSDQNAIQNKLSRRLRMEKLVSKISQNLLQAKSESVNNAIDQALAEVGRHSNTDRVYVYLARKSDDHLINTNEWVARDFKPIIEEQNAVNGEDFKWIHDKLRLNEVVHIPDIKQLPKNQLKLRTHLKSMGIKSTLSVPMHFKGKLIGFLGFDSFKKQKFWANEDIRLLSVVGDIFVNAIERISFEEDLVTLNEILSKKIDTTTKEVVDKNHKLTNYAFYNAHKLRGPLARLLGLVNLVKSNYLKKNEMPMVIDKLEEAASEMDEIVKEINHMIS